MLVLFFSCPVILSKPLNCPRGLTFFTCKHNWFTHLFMNVARIRCKNRSWFFEKCLLVLLPLVDTLLKSWTFLSCEVEVKVCFLWNIRRHSSKFIWRSSKSVYTHRAFLFFYSVFFFGGGQWWWELFGCVRVVAKVVVWALSSLLAQSMYWPGWQSRRQSKNEFQGGHIGCIDLSPVFQVSPEAGMEENHVLSACRVPGTVVASTVWRVLIPYLTNEET